MAKNPESPLEPFKRALVNATRSLAESPDLEIVYSGEARNSPAIAPSCRIRPAT